MAKCRLIWSAGIKFASATTPGSETGVGVEDGSGSWPIKPHPDINNPKIIKNAINQIFFVLIFYLILFQT